MFRRYIFLQILNNFFSILQDTAAMCLSRNITLNHSNSIVVADLVIHSFLKLQIKNVITT